MWKNNILITRRWNDWSIDIEIVNKTNQTMKHDWFKKRLRSFFFINIFQGQNSNNQSRLDKMRLADWNMCHTKHRTKTKRIYRVSFAIYNIKKKESYTKNERERGRKTETENRTRKLHAYSFSPSLLLSYVRMYMLVFSLSLSSSISTSTLAMSKKNEDNRTKRRRMMYYGHSYLVIFDEKSVCTW